MNKVALNKDGKLLCPKTAHKKLMGSCLTCFDNRGQGMDDGGNFFWCRYDSSNSTIIKERRNNG